ncbi:MAG: alpha-ketoglutarate-dependent dioxygenase AlkB [Bacteroidia bacterium]
MDLFGNGKTQTQVLKENLAKVNGLRLIEDFITPEDEKFLLLTIDKQPWLDDLSRKVQHYGYKYDYRARAILENNKVGEIPHWMDCIIDRLISQQVVNFRPDQAIINNYEVGQGIANHIDCEPCFDATIMSLSLGSSVVMEFKDKENPKIIVPILLKPRSLVILKDQARYEFTHGIAQRKSDVFNNTKHERKRRVSMTFRKVVLTK